MTEGRVQRPWPPPTGAAAMTVTLHEVVMMHWAVSPTKVAAITPAGLTLDTYDGQAYVSMLAMRMSNMSPGWLPRMARMLMPRITDFYQLNFRTYVNVAHKPGIHFLSVDVGSLALVTAMRKLYDWPVHRATIDQIKASGSVTYGVQRVPERRAHGAVPTCRMTCKLHAGELPIEAVEGSLDHFLAERFCEYMVDKRNRLLRSEVDHPSWELLPAEVEIRSQTISDALGLPLHSGPVLTRYCKQQQMSAWSPVEVGSERT